MLKEVVGAARSLYSLDQSEWRNRVGQLDIDSLSRELNRNRRLINLNDNLQRAEGMAGSLGVILSMFAGSGEGAAVFVGSLGATVFLRSRPAIVLDSRVNFISFEVSNRRVEAIFHQEDTYLARLETVFPNPS